MLAYVFWHYPTPRDAAPAYEAALTAFHETLAAHRPDGYEGSFVFRLPEAPWLVTERPVYEDWYLVRDFTALGLLNEGAVAGARQAPHDDVARRADGGAGGVYRLRAGAPAPSSVRCAVRFSKPAGMPYADFYAGIPAAAIAAGGGLWERQMVLGPAPEGCLLASDPVAVPHARDTLVVPVERVYPSEPG